MTNKLKINTMYTEEELDAIDKAYKELEKVNGLVDKVMIGAPIPRKPR